MGGVWRFLFYLFLYAVLSTGIFTGLRLACSSVGWRFILLVSQSVSALGLWVSD